MGGIEEKQIFQEMGFISSEKSQPRQIQWDLIEVKNNVTDKYESDFVEAYSDDLCDSLPSLSSSKMVDDAASSSSSSSGSSHNGPLYEFSELMAQLPVRKGLSKYYQGKSESFASLANLKSFEDLAKRGSHRSRRSIKPPCRSHGGGQSQSQTLSPKGTIVKNKKSSSSSIARSSLFSSLGNMTSLLDTTFVQNHF